MNVLRVNNELTSGTIAHGFVSIYSNVPRECASAYVTTDLAGALPRIRIHTVNVGGVDDIAAIRTETRKARFLERMKAHWEKM